MSQDDSKRATVKMSREFDRAGIETELFEETRDTPGPWKAASMSREVFYNMVQRSRNINRQVLDDIEREIEGDISPGAKAAIDEEMLKEAELDRIAME